MWKTNLIKRGIKMSFFEQHAHYNDEKFNEDREEVIQKVYNSGVAGIVNAGYSVGSSTQAIELAEKYSFIYYTYAYSLSENICKDNAKFHYDTFL